MQFVSCGILFLPFFGHFEVDGVDDDGVDDDGVEDDDVGGDDVDGLLMSGQFVKLGTLNDQSQTFSFEFQTNRFPLPRFGHSIGHIIFVHL